MRLINPGLLDPARAAKQVKALAHRFLPEYDRSLYIDNIARLKIAPKKLFDEFLAKAPSPLVCFRHGERNCVYDEAQEVLRLGYDNADRVRAQMASYRHLGYPAGHGLAKGTLLLRRHHDEALKPVMERWHQQVLCHSNRDQLSLNPVMWFDRFNPSYLSPGFSELVEWPVIKDDRRLPRDFDEARYLDLHPDVTFNARQHYLLYGASEMRAYK